MTEEGSRIVVGSQMCFVKQKTAYEIRLSVVGSEKCIRDRALIAITTTTTAIGSCCSVVVGGTQATNSL